MPSRHVDQPELSSARISRLLRPLRTHCSSLVNYATRIRLNHLSSKAVSNETYDKYPHLSPLSILPQPGSLESRQYPPHDTELARRIYAVRDCFQHIVVNTKPHAPDRDASRIQSLAALCSTIVGDHMEDQIESNEGERDEEQNGDVIHSLYVAIPTEYRRCALLSHALKLILSRCGDHPTLLMRLLDVTLSHHLVYESTCLLHAVICLAFSKRLPTFKTAPICHSAHFGFFTDLLSRWVSSDFSDSTFFRIFINHLEESQDPELWGSKAVQDIVQVTYTQDFPAHLRFICTSLQLTTQMRTDHGNEPTTNRSLLSRTSEWLNILLELHPSVRGLSDPCRVNAAHFDEVGDMLTCVLPLVCRPGDLEPPDGLDANIQSLLLSLSVAWLSIGISQSQTPSQSLVDQLSTTLPCLQTFTPLIARVFTDSNGCLSVFRTAMEGLTSALTAPVLLHLKASLLGCALHYIEHPSHERELATKNTASEVQSYRHQLINLIDDAEDTFKMPRAKSSMARLPSERTSVFATPLRRELFRDISAWESKLGSCPRSEDRHSARKRRKLAQSRYSSSSQIERPFQSSSQPNGGQKLDAKTMFMSLLSCATSQRATLHPIQETTYIRTQSEAPPEYYELDSSGDEPLYDQHSLSDDALDLFTWASSSPVIHKQ